MKHETDIASLEAEIDRLVHGLYGLTEEEITLGEWERLNRLKAVNAEAFYYWYRANMVG